MSGSQIFQTPFDRLTLLPTTMNWRGTWSPTQQYFTNDVVISPVNFGTYILITVVATNGPPEPSVGPLWAEFSGAAIGVNEITAGNGITIGGSQTNPTVANNGVIAIDGGAGISVTGTNDLRTIANTGVLAVTAGAGISVNNADPQNPVIRNTGILGLTAGAGISIPPFLVGSPPIINNSGVISITAGANVTVDNTDPQNPIIGVVADASTALNSGQVPTFVPNPCAAGSSSSIVLLGAGLIDNYLTNGPPTPNGIFLINMASLNLFFTQVGGSPVAPANTLDISFEDGNGASYSSGQQIVLQPSAIYPINSSAPLLLFDVNAAISNGLQNLAKITFTNTTTSDCIMTSCSYFTAVYYPNGLQ